MTYRGITRGNTIEFDRPLPYPDGQSVEVSVEPLPPPAPAGSIEAILQAMSEPPRLPDADVDELEQAIADSRIPVRHEGLFDAA